VSCCDWPAFSAAQTNPTGSRCRCFAVVAAAATVADHVFAHPRRAYRAKQFLTPAARPAAPAGTTIAGLLLWLPSREWTSRDEMRISFQLVAVSEPQRSQVPTAGAKRENKDHSPTAQAGRQAGRPAGRQANYPPPRTSAGPVVMSTQARQGKKNARRATKPMGGGHLKAWPTGARHSRGSVGRERGEASAAGRSWRCS